MVFFQTKEQEQYIKNLESAIRTFSERAAELDESRGFPFENMEELKKFGYHTLTLSKNMEEKVDPFMIFYLVKKRLPLSVDQQHLVSVGTLEQYFR